MNQSKFSWADILGLLSSLVFGYMCFLGLNFLNIANQKIWGMPVMMGCIVIASLISILLFGIAYGAKLLKRTSRNFKTSRIAELSMLTVFGILAVFLASHFSPFTHYFTVWSQKNEISQKLDKHITQAEGMFQAYEEYVDSRESNYKEKLNSVVNAKRAKPEEYNSFGFNSSSGISDADQIENKMFILHADLFPTNYSESELRNGIKEVATDWLSEAKTTTQSWKPISLVGVVNEIDFNSTEWLSSLAKLSQVQELQEQPPNFEYPLSFNDVKTHFTTIHQPTSITIVIATFSYLLMLLPWIVTKRDSRSTGSLTTSPYEVVL